MSEQTPLTSFYYDCYVFDVPIRYRSNCAEIGQWVAAAFPHHRPLGSDEARPRLVVEIIVDSLPQTAVGACPGFSFTLHEHRLRGQSALGSLQADGLAGTASAFVSSALLSDMELFLQEVIACLGLFIVCWQGRLPIHAAAVQSRDTTLVLSGASGAGKSSLAYSCWQRGWRLLSEDTVYLDWRRDACIWANPRFIHMLAQSRQLFPELRDRPAILLPSGKTKIRLPLSEAVSFPAANLVLCLLQPNHAERGSSWESCASDIVVNQLLAGQETGFAIAYPFRHEARAALLDLPAVTLASGHDLPELDRVLHEIVDAHTG